MRIDERSVRLSVEHWEKYYRDGVVATCPTSPAGEYDLELRQVWEEFFEELPEGASLLDIGTGNGAVVLIARETARRLGRNWNIHGADLARIDPARHVRGGQARFEGCRFHPGMATESLTFDDDFFDVVTGHYALEYSDIPGAMAAIHRVLKAGGRARFIIHHDRSVLVANAHRSLAESEFVLNQTRVYRYLRRLVTMDDASPSPQGRETVNLRQRIQALRQAREQAARSGGGMVLNVTLDAIRRVLAARPGTGPEAAGREVDRIESELRASVRRLRDLLGRARDERGMVEMEDQARDAGFEIEEREAQYHAGDNLVGWRLTLRKK
ncbi:MAG: methyltransferase domain-containing protein [Wenzhouxiangella sp.]